MARLAKRLLRAGRIRVSRYFLKCHITLKLTRAGARSAEGTKPRSGLASGAAPGYVSFLLRVLKGFGKLMLSRQTYNRSSQCDLANRKPSPTTKNMLPNRVNCRLQLGELVTTPLQDRVASGSSSRKTPLIASIPPTNEKVKPIRRYSRLERFLFFSRLVSMKHNATLQARARSARRTASAC